ncbi:hydroxymethylbilane synthase [soil metagenome]
MRIGTRKSDLALWQARHVAARLREAGHQPELLTIVTTGDRILDVPLAQIGDKGLFTKEIDEALLSGDADLAVHSLKDLPTRLPDGLVLAAVTSRDDPRDAFVARADFAGNLEDLPEGAILATSSLRRRAQLLAWRPDLRIVDVRGNVPTRLAKLDASGGGPDGTAWHGIVLACAGLRRLGLAARMQPISPEIMLPAVAQGALGIVCAETGPVAQVADILDEHEPRATTTAERALLRALEGGCQVPVAGHAIIRDGRIILDGSVASLDGKRVLRERATGLVEEAEEVGLGLAARLQSLGADQILAEIRANQ